jgi:ABC-type oligopeptide transport system substrate-binding subunit
MKKIILATAALLAVSGSAFAGSDNYGSNGANQPAVAVDSSHTASVNRSEPAATQKPVTTGADHNLFGNN